MSLSQERTTEQSEQINLYKTQDEDSVDRTIESMRKQKDKEAWRKSEDLRIEIERKKKYEQQLKNEESS